MANNDLAESPTLPEPSGINSQVAYVSFIREVDTKTISALLSHCSNLVQHGVKEIYLLMSSPGGNIPSGFAGYNQLRALPIKLHTHNIGSVDSIAIILFLAGEYRTSSRHSTFLFHQVNYSFPTHLNVPHYIVNEAAAYLNECTQNMEAVILERTKMSRKEIRNITDHKAVANAKYAEKHEIVNEIAKIQIPEGATLIQV